MLGTKWAFTKRSPAMMNPDERPASLRDMKRTNSKMHFFPLALLQQQPSRFSISSATSTSRGSSSLDIEFMLKMNVNNCQAKLLEELERTHSAETLRCLLALLEWECLVVQENANMAVRANVEHALVSRFLLRGCEEEICLPSSLRQRILLASHDQDIVDMFLEMKECMLGDLKQNASFMRCLHATTT